MEKLVSRYYVCCQTAAENRRRFKKRSGMPPGTPKAQHPQHWDAHPHFNPFHVRSRLDSFAYSIAEKLRSGQYELKPSITLGLPKPEGGTREVSVFSLPDAAVSYWLGRRLIARNTHFFSSYSYAYRADRNAHHAIHHLMTEIRSRSRVFVLEYDFAKYFDSIEHEYLLRVMRRYGFMISKKELGLVERLLKNPRARGLDGYKAEAFESPIRGVPQGSTVSLFLANVACYELDREIERAGATFARYADGVPEQLLDQRVKVPSPQGPVRGSSSETAYAGDRVGRVSRHRPQEVAAE